MCVMGDGFFFFDGEELQKRSALAHFPCSLQIFVSGWEPDENARHVVSIG